MGLRASVSAAECTRVLASLWPAVVQFNAACLGVAAVLAMGEGLVLVVLAFWVVYGLLWLARTFA